MRSLLDPAAAAYLGLFLRWKRYGALPRAGGLYDQLARDLEAFDVIHASLATHAIPSPR